MKLKCWSEIEDSFVFGRILCEVDIGVVELISVDMIMALSVVRLSFYINYNEYRICLTCHDVSRCVFFGTETSDFFDVYIEKENVYKLFLRSKTMQIEIECKNLTGVCSENLVSG